MKRKSPLSAMQRYTPEKTIMYAFLRHAVYEKRKEDSANPRGFHTAFCERGKSKKEKIREKMLQAEYCEFIDKKRICAAIVSFGGFIRVRSA